MDAMFLYLFVASYVSLVKAIPQIYIGGLFPSLPNKARVPGQLLITGSRLALDHINNDTSLLPGYILNMTEGDSKCDPKVSFNTMVKLLANPPNKLVMYGAACSDATAYLAGMTAMANVVQVSHTSTSLTLSDKTKYPSLYRVIPTDFPAIQAALSLLKRFNWTTVAIIGEKNPSGLLVDSYNHAVKELRKLNITIQWNKIITSNEIQECISEMKENDVRIILTIVSAGLGKKLLSEAFHSGVYGPKYVWFWLETLIPHWWSDGNKTKDDMIKKAVQYSFGFGDNLNVLDNTTTTIEGRTPHEIWKEYLFRLNLTNIPALATYSYDGVWFIAKALDALVKDHGVKLENVKTGNKSFYDLLLSKMKSITFSGLTGDFKIFAENKRERLDGPVHIYQYDKDGKTIEIMTYDVSNSHTVVKTGFLWKDNIPRDREFHEAVDKTIVYKLEEIEEWIFIILTVLSGISIFVSFIFIVHLVIFIVRSGDGKTAAIFNIVISIGCICMSTAGILYGLRVMDKLDDYNQVKETCMSQLGLTSVGLTLILGALISKLFGIFQIRIQGSSGNVYFGSMILPLLIFVAIDVVLVTLWLNEHAPKSIKTYYEKQKTVSSMGRTITIPFNEFCTKEKYSDWMIMIYIFHSVQALLSLILAALTKGSSTQQVDDGTWTRGSVIFSFLMFLGVILSDVPDRDTLSSLKLGYVVFTSVVSGCSLIILFQLYTLKICCSSSVATPKKHADVKLTNINVKNNTAN